MPAPDITDLPEAPSLGDPTNFQAKAEAFVGSLPLFVSDVNAFGDYLDANTAPFTRLEFASPGALDASNSLVVDGYYAVQSTKVPGGFETFLIAAAGTYTANGDTVRDLTGVAGQAVSLRRTFNTLADLLADTRPAGFFVSNPAADAENVEFYVDEFGASYRMALSGATDQHLSTTGGVKLYVQPVNGVLHFAAANPSTISAENALLETMASYCVAQGISTLKIAQPTLVLDPGLTDPILGDINLVGNNTEITGGYPRAATVQGFKQSGVPDGAFANEPTKLPQSDKLKAFVADAASRCWAIYPNAEGLGGRATRYRSLGAATLTGSGDAGATNPVYDRVRRDLSYFLTKAFVCKATPSATSGTWTTSTMSAALWPDAGTGTNLLATQNLQTNTGASGDYIEFDVTPDRFGQFNVAFHMFGSASDSVEIVDQSAGVTLETLSLSSTTNGYRVFKLRAVSYGNFTLRIVNNGGTNAELRVIGVNLFDLFSDYTEYNPLETYDTFNYVREATADLNSGSAATPVFTARQGGAGGNGITAGSNHGGETRVSTSWEVDNSVWDTTESPYTNQGGASTVFTVGKTIRLVQKTTLNWDDGQTATYDERIEYSADGVEDRTSTLSAPAGLRISNIYGTMEPVNPGYQEILYPRNLDVGTPPAADIRHYPAITGGNIFAVRNPATGRTITVSATTYPNAQTREIPGMMWYDQSAVTDGRYKLYVLQYFGADVSVNYWSGRTTVRYS